MGLFGGYDPVAHQKKAAKKAAKLAKKQAKAELFQKAKNREVAKRKSVKKKNSDTHYQVDNIGKKRKHNISDKVNDKKAKGKDNRSWWG